MEQKAKAYIIHEGTKRAATVILLNEQDLRTEGATALFIGAVGGVLGVREATMEHFRIAYIALALGETTSEKVAEVIAWEMFALYSGSKGKKITPEAIDALEGVLKMDTRGKSAEQIRQEILRIVEGLPQGNALRTVPTSYPDRAQAIAAYTAIRQAIFALSNATSKGSPMTKKITPAAAAAPVAAVVAPAAAAAPAPATKTKAEIKAEAALAKAQEAAAKAAQAAADAAAKAAQKAADAAAAVAAKAAAGQPASPAAAGVAAAAAQKNGAAKPKADFSGKYILAGEAMKVKTTEELGMHEASVRTRVLAVIFASKAKNGVEYAALEVAGGDKTRGAVAYLIKKGFISKAVA